MSKHVIAAALVGGVCAGFAAGQEAAPVKQGEPVKQAEPAKADGPAVTAGYKNADELLTALETADANLKTLTADIKYDKIDGIAGDRQIRRGKVFFQDKGDVDGKRDRKFSVRFDQLRQGGRVDDETKLFIFDGEWLIEVTPKFKQVVKRQVVPPGEKFDPLKIGEGPLPLPIGQKKADIAARFYGELLPSAAGLDGPDKEEAQKQKDFVEGSFQLRLVPKPNTEEAGKFKEIRLWYRDLADGAGLLPRMARTETPKGDISLIQMVQVDVITPIDPKMMGVGELDANWNVDVQAWEGDGREQ